MQHEIKVKFYRDFCQFKVVNKVVHQEINAIWLLQMSAALKCSSISWHINRRKNEILRKWNFKCENLLQTSSSYSAILENNSKKDVSLERMKTRLKSSSSRYHILISDKEDSSFPTPNTTTRGKQVLDSMVIYNGLSRNKCSVILDNGRGTSYVSTLLIEKMNKRPSKMEVGNTDITLNTATKNYHEELSNIGGYHSFQLKVKKTDKRILLLHQTETTKQFEKKKDHLKKVQFVINWQRLYYHSVFSLKLESASK